MKDYNGFSAEVRLRTLAWYKKKLLPAGGSIQPNAVPAGRRKAYLTLTAKIIPNRLAITSANTDFAMFVT